MSTNPEATAPLGRHNWGWFLFRGIIAIALGILAFFFPLGALVAFAAVFAAFALIDGIAAFVIGIRGAWHHQRRSWGLILSGIFGIAVGVIFLIWPFVSTIAYAVVTLALLSIWAIFTGILELATAIQSRHDMHAGAWLLGVSGVLSLILGIAIPLITGFAPGASILSVGWLIAIYALAVGITFLVLAFRVRGRTSG